MCGGCTLPGVPYAEQLEKKRADLSRLLRRDVPPLIPSPSESGFRSKVAFVFSPAGKSFVMGHFALALRQAQGDPERSRGVGSKRVIPIDECPVHHERGNRIAFALRDHLQRGRVPAGLLRHIIVRTTADGREASAMLVVYRNDKSLRAPVKKFLASAEKPDGFFVNVHDKPGPFMVGEETIKSEGRSHVKEVVNGVSYLVSPTAFFQTNVGAAAEIVKLVMAAIVDGPVDGQIDGRIDGRSDGRSDGQIDGPNGPSLQGPKGPSLQVLDLYCGSGLFSLPLAKAGARVTAIEENRQAIKDAEANLRLNRMHDAQVKFIAGKVEEIVIRLKADSTDIVVLDPPRQGCPPKVLSAIFERMRPAKAVYVSCNPEALAAELPVILKAGYRIAQLQPVDMFPHTNHIETVVTLER